MTDVREVSKAAAPGRYRNPSAGTELRPPDRDGESDQGRVPVPSIPVPNNRHSVAALATGIVAALMAIVAMGWLGILAIFWGRKGKDAVAYSAGTQRGAGLAKAGEVLGWVALAFTLLLIAGYSGVEDTYWR